MLPSLALARARELCGQVVMVGPHEETTPAVGVVVTLKETGDTVRSKAQGLFRLFLPDLFKAGETHYRNGGEEGLAHSVPLGRRSACTSKYREGYH